MMVLIQYHPKYLNAIIVIITAKPGTLKGPAREILKAFNDEVVECSQLNATSLTPPFSSTVKNYGGLVSKCRIESCSLVK